MRDEDATPVEGQVASSGAMRVVMLNARTAVLVPVDAPDPAPADAGVSWQDPSDTDTDVASDDAAGQSAAWTHDATAAEADPSDNFPELAETGEDAMPVAGQTEPDTGATGPEFASDTAQPADPDTVADAPATGSDSRWRAELLARLDDLGRLLARATVPEPPPGDALARLTADLARMDQRLTAAVADIAARVDALEAAGTDAGQTAAAGLDTVEAISDLRMQLRMVEVQVGTLGKLIVSGGPDEANAPDGLRTRLAELMAREQRIATGA